MRNQRMGGKRILAWGLGLLFALGIATTTAATPGTRAIGAAAMGAVPSRSTVDYPQAVLPQVTLVYIDGKRTVQCAPDVDVDAVAARAAVTLAQGSTTASPVQTIQTQRVASNGAETLDEAGLFAYLTEENPLQVQYTKQLVSFETVHFTTVIEEDDTLYEDEIRVVRAGVDGEARVVSEVTYLDGTAVSSEEISREITTKPVARIVHVGTLERPEWWPTGSMIQPAQGRLSSDYGRRHYEFHTGVDIATEKGSPVVAADGGTVIYAGWWGNYGNYIQIDHNGVVTAYAHNSKLLVEVGDHVTKGQQIAEVGSTGRSTGPHCHFEVLIGYEFQDPHDYVDFVFEEN